MLFAHRRPSPPLDRFVESVWICQQDAGPLRLERVLPTGASQLIINLKEDETRLYDSDRGYRCLATSGSVLSGGHSQFQTIDTSEQEHVAGVAFKPGGTVGFLRVPAYETADRDVPLEDLIGVRRTTALRTRLLERDSSQAGLGAIEAALLELWTSRPIHPAVTFALHAIDRAPHTACIAEVTDAVGMSAKRFIERFKAEVGMTPKRYCRVRRFQRALATAHRPPGVDWTQVALDCGYFDQAHFIHDFKSFAGVTPTGYQAARTPFQNHVKILQSGDAAL